MNKESNLIPTGGEDRVLDIGIGLLCLGCMTGIGYAVLVGDLNAGIGAILMPIVAIAGLAGTGDES